MDCAFTVTIERRGNYFYYANKQRCVDGYVHDQHIYCVAKLNLIEKINTYYSKLSELGRCWFRVNNKYFVKLSETLIACSMKNDLWPHNYNILISNALNTIIYDDSPTICRLRDISLSNLKSHTTQEMLYITLSIYMSSLMMVDTHSCKRIVDALSHEITHRRCDLKVILCDLNCPKLFAGIIMRYINWA
jgi:hypothetical protein